MSCRILAVSIDPEIAGRLAEISERMGGVAQDSMLAVAASKGLGHGLDQVEREWAPLLERQGRQRRKRAPR